MEHPYQNSLFCKLLKEHLNNQMFTQEQFAEMIRVSREQLNRIISGAVPPSLRLVGSITYTLCLSPHDARALFDASGFCLDSPDPRFQRARTIIDSPHDTNNPEELRASLNLLAEYGFSNPDRDGI